MPQIRPLLALLLACTACGGANAATAAKPLPEPASYAWWDPQREVPEASAPAPSSGGNAPASVDEPPAQERDETAARDEREQPPAQAPATMDGGDDDGAD